MLRITVVLSDDYDEAKQEFIVTTFVLELEHSLVSMSKWESRHEKPFLSNTPKSGAELLDYVKAMVLTQEAPPEAFECLSEENVREINDYIAAKMTATWFRELGTTKSTEIITAEIVYYWMIQLNIPFECQYWHFNKLFTLIRVINEKNAPKKKLTAAEAVAERQRLNAERRAAANSTG